MNPQVCFEMDILAHPIPASTPCKWDIHYQSGIGFGTAFVVENHAERIMALDAIMAQYASGDYAYPEEKVKIPAIIRLDIESRTGKSSGFDT